MKWSILAIVIEFFVLAHQVCGFGEIPTYFPTETAVPSPSPSENPTESPTSPPTESPAPSPSPSEAPTQFPTYIPTRKPSLRPSVKPSSRAPSVSPTLVPTSTPTSTPTRRPTSHPTNVPTLLLSSGPSTTPSDSPSNSMLIPSAFPLYVPSVFSTMHPTLRASPDDPREPSQTSAPSAFPNGALGPTQAPQNGLVVVPMEPTTFYSHTLSPTSHLATPTASSTLTPTETSFPTGIYHQKFANASMTIVGVSGVMEDSTITIFEELGLELLNELFPRITDVNIDFLFIQVDTQLFREGRRSLRVGTNEDGELTINFKAAAIISTQNVGALGFQFSIQSFFATQSREFIRRLQRADIFFGEVERLPDISNAENDSAATFFSAPISVLLGLSLVSFFIIGSTYTKKRNQRLKSRTLEKNSVGLDGPIDGIGPLLISCSATAPVSNEHIDQLSENDNSSAFYDHEETMEEDDRDLYDEKEIFLSLSDTSLSWRNPKPKSSNWIPQRSPRSLRSGYSSTTGSKLAGIEIEFTDSEVTPLSPIPNDRYSKLSSRYSVSGMSALTEGEFISIRERPRNLFDDTYAMHPSESESTYDVGSPSKQQESMEHQSIQNTTLSSRLQKARENKRSLETVHDWRPRESNDHSTQGASTHFMEMRNPGATAPKSSDASRKVSYDDSERDGSETIPQSQSEDSRIERITEQKKKPQPNNRGVRYHSLDRLQSREKIQKSEKSRGGKRHGQRRNLFGMRKKESKWDKKEGFTPLSPSKRHRRKGRGALGPNHLSLSESDLETCQEDDGERDHSEELLLARGESSDDKYASSSKGPSRQRKHRPPKLDLYKYDSMESDPMYQVDDQYHKATTNENDVNQGPDPVGHTLSSYRARALMTEAKTEYSDPPSKTYDDPPTAAEHRRRRQERTRKKEDRLYARRELSTERSKENRKYSRGERSKEREKGRRTYSEKDR